MKLLTLLHRWLGFPVGIVFFILLLTGIINGGEELFQLTRGYDQVYLETTLEEDAAALVILSKKYPAARQFLMPTEGHPFYQVRSRGETATYRIGDLELIAFDNSQGGFFSTILTLHRSLLLGREDVLFNLSGREIVAWGGLLSLILSLVGLYMWWPMRKSFRLNNSLPKNTQRSSLQKSHINLGVLVLVLVILLSLTGAGITYRTVARSVLNAQQQSDQGIFQSPVFIDNNWKSWLFTAKQSIPNATLERISLPRINNEEAVPGTINPRAAIQFRFNTESDWFGLAASKVYIDQHQSALIGVSYFGERSAGQQLYELMVPLHTGRGLTPGYLVALLIPTVFTVLMVFFGIWSFWKKKNKLAEFKPKRNSIFALDSAQWQPLILFFARYVPGQVFNFSSVTAFSPINDLLDEVADGTIKQGAMNASRTHSIKTPTVLYATQTGNTETLADGLKQLVLSENIDLNVYSIADYAIENLATEDYLLLIVSTQGNGNVPDDAIDMHEALLKGSLKLSHLNYSVLALGDSCYEFFCQAGKDFDDLLCRAGATRIMSRVDCDVEFESDAASWSKSVIQFLQNNIGQTLAANNLSQNNPEMDAATNQYCKAKPYQASLLSQKSLSGDKSTKDIRHVEIDLADSGLHYTVGDGLGIWFRNEPELVMQAISLCDLSANEIVTVGEQKMTLLDALSAHFELSLLHLGFVQAYALLVKNSALLKISQNSARLRAYIKSTDEKQERKVMDVLHDFPSSLTGQQFLSCLRKLTPRIYSIASSQKAQSSIVAITVGVVRYHSYGYSHLGAASGFLADRVATGESLNIFIEKNNKFRLPDNSDTNIIMIGPGTGIAPFRAFLQERRAINARGNNWLFFGNPHAAEDYLYEDELQEYLKQGLLNRLDLAFSQDQSHKIYVQQRLREQGKKIFQWLEKGAHVYVCGDAKKMAEDVNTALLDIVQEHGALTAQQTQDYFSNLRRAKRYQRDVY